MGLHLQSSNLLGPRLGQPGEDGAGRIGFDDLLGSPEAIGRGCRLYPDQLVNAQSQLGQPAHMRLLGRRHQVQAPPLACERWDGRPEQAPLADRCLRRQELRQAAPGPAATRKLGIERGKARGDCGSGLPSEVRAAPKGLCHMRWQGPGLWRARAHAACSVQVRRVVRAGRKGDRNRQGWGR